jgi:hypothetical protein
VKIVQEFGYNEMMRKKKVIRTIKLKAKARHKPCFKKFMKFGITILLLVHDKLLCVF